MRVYFAMLRIPPSLKDNINAFGSAENFQRWSFKNGMWESLFAYTIKKKYLKKFKELHGTKYFKYFEKDFVDDNEFHNTIESSILSHEIKIVKIKNKNKTIKLYITEEEENVTNDTYNTTTTVFEKLYDSKGHLLPFPSIFKKDVLVLLEKLGYTTIFYEYASVLPDVGGGENEYENDLISDYQVFCDNASWADCSTGAFTTSEGILSNRPKMNFLDSFIFNYEKILEGE